MPKGTPVSLADLAQSCVVLRPEDYATCCQIAEVLGFVPVTPSAPAEHAPAPESPRLERPTFSPSQPVGPSPFGAPEPEPPEPEPRRGEATTRPSLSFGLDGPTKVPSALAGAKPEWWEKIRVLDEHVDPARIPPAEPLLLPIWSRTTYMHALWTAVMEGRLNSARLVELVARLEVPAEIPRLPLPTMRRGVQVLVDYGEAMMPFRDDQRRLVREVQELAGGSTFFEAFLFRGTPARWSRTLIPRPAMPGEERRSALATYELPPAGTPILALTDLGIGALSAGQSYVPPEEWRDFAQSADASGCHLTAFVPYHRDRCPGLLRDEMTIVHWHHPRGAPESREIAFRDGSEVRRLLDGLQRRNPQAVALAHLASLASRVELSLLRELRLTLLPEADGGAEADLWFSRLGSVHSETALLLRPGVAEVLRRSLFQADPGLFEAAWGIVKAFRARTGAFEGTRLEEEINYWLAKGGDEAEANVRDRLRRAVKTVYERGTKDEEGLALWSVELLDSLPQAARDSEAGRDLGAAAGFLLDPSYVPQGVLPDDLEGRQWLIQVDPASLTTISLWVGREPEGLVLSDRKELIPGGRRLDDVPATIPLVIWLSWNGGQHREKVAITPGQRAGPIDTGDHKVTLETFTGLQWKLTPSTGETPIEEAPSPTWMVVISLRNQDVINAFAEVGQAFSLTGGDLMSQNGISISTLASDRAGSYQGPNLATLPKLTPEQQKMLLARLRAALSLAGNALETLPDEVFTYANQRRLDLSRNQLTSLPPRIGELAGLEELILDDNRLESLPPEIGRLTALQTLSAAGNELTDLPEELALLKELRHLDLRDNALTGLPEALGKLEHVEALDLQDNQLESLPPSLAQLVSLQSLNLAGNRLDELPDEPDWLARLQSLDLRSTPLALAGGVLAEVIRTQVNSPKAIIQAYRNTRARSDHYADLEIRVLERGAEGYPVEITLDYEQMFPRGYLRAGSNPPTPTDAHYADQTYGEKLFEWLFADDRLKTAWLETQGQYPQRRIRLRVDAMAPELYAIPWEVLRDPGEGTPPQNLAASSATPFSRYLAVPRPPGSPILQRPIRMLVVIANPSYLPGSLKPIPVEAEVNSLRQVLGELRRKGEVQVTILPGRTGLSPELRAQLEDEGYQIAEGVASLDNILRMLPGCHVLHFLGHGEFEREEQTGEGRAVLHLENADGAWEPVMDEEFTRGLTNIDPQPHLVFLAACEIAEREPGAQNPFVGLAPKLVSIGVSAVVAVQDQVPMDTARQFSRLFYLSLLEHGQVDLASNEVRSVLLAADLPGAGIPVLFMRLRDGQLLAPSPTVIIPLAPFEPETVLVPAGPFLMGSQPAEGVSKAETPQHLVELPAYRIGKYPVTNRQYAEFVRRTGHDVPPEAGWEGQAPPGNRLDHPVMGVTWYDAIDYCAWLSEQTGRQYRLPSEAEWEKAARGTEGRVYPWGDEWDPTRCNHGSDQTTPVDAYPAQSLYGCYDMIGNVREWTGSLWGESLREPDSRFLYPWEADDREDYDAPEYVLRIHRGGAAADDIDRLRCSARNGFAPDRPGPPGKRHGFRVALVPDDLTVKELEREPPAEPVEEPRPDIGRRPPVERQDRPSTQDLNRDFDGSELMRSIREGRCVPIISGTLQYSQAFGLGDEDIDEHNIKTVLAESWADYVGYPFANRYELDQVATYVQTEALNRHEAGLRYLRFLKGLALNLAEKDPDMDNRVLRELESEIDALSFAELLTELDHPKPTEGEQDSLEILAKLPLPMYITTDYHDFVERALRRVDRSPRTQICFWSGEPYSMVSEHRLDPDFEPTPAEPLVYHLYGFEQYPETMVLSTDDYLDFLIQVAQRTTSQTAPLIPLDVRAALAQSTLLALGYHATDVSFRTLYQSFLLQRASLRRTGLLVMPSTSLEEQQLDEYRAYLQPADMQIFWGTAAAFLDELWDHWQREDFSFGPAARDRASERPTLGRRRRT